MHWGVPDRRRSRRLTLLGAGLCIALSLAACSKKEGGGPKREPPLVDVATPKAHLFVDRIEAVGTARANEQVTLASPVTERIERLNFDDGDFVQRGRVLAVLAQGQEQAALNGARAAEDQANAQLRRIQELAQRGFATNTLLDQQVAAAQRARAEAEDARAQIGDRVIRAPFSGHVSLRTISEGAVVNAGAVIATVSDLSRIKLDFTVPETMLSALRPGQPIVARAAAYPDTPFRGTIASIDPVIDPATRAVMVRAVLPNPGNRLKPGMLLSVGIESASRSGMAVPELAVIGEGANRYVYLVGADNKAVRTKVTTGLRDGGLIEVSGLRPDARVISEGVVKVAEGTRVRLRGSDGTRTAQRDAAGPPPKAQAGAKKD
ncbi:efflux RND transporter periplasmic adaptor subunit [Sphingomonas sp. XMGL2]|uniref:Efflux RND transporter periplasmic adaptor subunit n=2 Tax=Sphingomonas quercus TaxID=2842451 RepID=A0ABS6BL03_9SPHN|nr:efflux RND transporter periplasmic adaptor subunit [Sphingomonas quercus]